jgi:hypothetical protein
MAQIFVLNSAYGLMTAVAAIDAGQLPPSEHRILLSVNAALVPELGSGPGELGFMRGLVSRFDRGVALNDLIAPIPPTLWNPPESEWPLLERLLRAQWGLGSEPVELFVQSPQVSPSRALASVFIGAPLTVIGDGLMTYSPIRDRLGRGITGRMRAVAYADVVPGVEPVLFTETGAARVPVAAARMRAVVEAVAAEVRDVQLDGLAASGAPTALVLGQYLAELQLVTPEEEEAMQVEMIDRAVGFGAERVVFKPHPSAPPSVVGHLAARAKEHGLEWALYSGSAPAEVLATRLHVVGFAAGFSSALTSARALFDVPIASAGTEMLLQRLEPFENSNRIPVTIIDALTRADSPYRTPATMQGLIDAVGYCMQPTIMSHLRPRAERVLRGLDDSERHRYFSRKRLAELSLPGARANFLTRALTPTGDVTRVEELRLTITGARRRWGRALKALQGR